MFTWTLLYFFFLENLESAKKREETSFYQSATQAESSDEPSVIVVPKKFNTNNLPRRNENSQASNINQIDQTDMEQSNFKELIKT